MVTCNKGLHQLSECAKFAVVSSTCLEMTAAVINCAMALIRTPRTIIDFGPNHRLEVDVEVQFFLLRGAFTAEEPATPNAMMPSFKLYLSPS